MLFLISICAVYALFHSIDICLRRRQGRPVTAFDLGQAIVVVLIAILALCVPAAAQIPPEVLPVETYVCRTLTARGGYGSGVLIHGKTPENKRYILTAYHVLDGSPVRVTWDGVTWYDAKPACVREIDDSAILTVTKWPDTVCGLPSTGIKLADQEVKPGETVYAFGFDGPSSTLRSLAGQCIGHSTSKTKPGRWFDLDTPSSEGMSGGPMVVLRGGQPRLIGNLWGTDDITRTTGCRLSVMQSMWGLVPSDPEGLENDPGWRSLTKDELQPYHDAFVKGLTEALQNGEDYVIKDKTGKVKPEHLTNAAGESLHHLDNEHNSNRLDLRPKHLPAMLPKEGVPSDGDPRFGPQWGTAPPNQSNSGPVGLRRTTPNNTTGVNVRRSPQVPVAPST